MALAIRNVTEHEVGDFVAVLKDAAIWLKNEGMEMWDPNQLSAVHLLKYNSIDQLFIGYMNHEAAAVMILQEEDPTFWPDAKGDSLFIHKLAVRRDYAKQGYSRAMIQWAKTRARSLNKKYVRLDCAADRPKLREFYELQGFQKVSERIMFGTYPTAFYEVEIHF